MSTMRFSYPFPSGQETIIVSARVAEESDKHDIRLTSHFLGKRIAAHLFGQFCIVSINKFDPDPAFHIRGRRVALLRDCA